MDDTPQSDGWARDSDPFDSLGSRNHNSTAATNNKKSESTVTSDWGRSSPHGLPKQKAAPVVFMSSTQSEELHKKFANVSSISSDAFFGREEVPFDLFNNHLNNYAVACFHS